MACRSPNHCPQPPQPRNPKAQNSLRGASVSTPPKLNVHTCQFFPKYSLVLFKNFIWVPPIITPCGNLACIAVIYFVGAHCSTGFHDRIGDEEVPAACFVQTRLLYRAPTECRGKFLSVAVSVDLSVRGIRRFRSCEVGSSRKKPAMTAAKASLPYWLACIACMSC